MEWWNMTRYVLCSACQNRSPRVQDCRVCEGNGQVEVLTKEGRACRDQARYDEDGEEIYVRPPLTMKEHEELER
jgi:DnaJ-class molecular chaperone